MAPGISVSLHSPTTTSPDPTATYASLPVAADRPTPMETATTTITPTPTITSPPSPTSTLVPTAVPGAGTACQSPPLLPGVTLSLLPSGSILVQAFRENGIWAFSKGLTGPYFIAAPVEDMVGLANLSPSRTQIAFQGANEDIVLYDLLTEGKTLIPWQESWHARSVSGWSTDGRLELFVRYEKTLGEGVVWETLLLDPITLQVGPVTQEFHLPNYYFDDKNPFHGFA
ncbi:MAG: hypothetical protein KC413_17960, partial [Anaerolineales bacterium]|nr:hypothetical protein [Anaerolineales bacterium]